MTLRAARNFSLKVATVVVTIAACCILTVCGILSSSSSPSLQKLLSAPEQVTIEGLNLELETYLWRDFMPTFGEDPDHTKLIALIWIVETDSISIPDWLKAYKLWVIYGEEVWETRFSKEPRPPVPPYKVEQVARKGPRWPVGAHVDVVVGIMDRNRVGYLLRVSGQPIRRAD